MPRDRLLLQPLPRVAFVRTGAHRQVDGSERSRLGKVTVVTEMIADLDGEDVEHAGCRLQQALDQMVALLRALRVEMLEHCAHIGPPLLTLISCTGQTDCSVGDRRARQQERPTGFAAELPAASPERWVERQIGRGAWYRTPFILAGDRSS